MPHRPWGLLVGRRASRISLCLPEQTRSTLSLEAQHVLLCEDTFAHRFSLKLWAGSVQGAGDAVDPWALAGSRSSERVWWLLLLSPQLSPAP